MILQSILAMLGYTFLMSILGRFLWKKTNIPFILSFALSQTMLTFFLYLSSLRPMSPITALVISVVSTIITIVILKRHLSLPLSSIPKKYVVFILFASILLLIPRFSFLTSPFSKELTFPYIGDETKHIAVLTSIAASDRFPPRFPFDPTIPFSYYYFYYLIPGTILKLFPHAMAGFIWFTHVYLTQIATYGGIATIIVTITKKPWIQMAGMGLAFFGPSFKIIPKLFRFWGIEEPHIEHWWQIPGDPVFGKPDVIGWQITHPMTLAIWTPQHQWAGAIAALIFLFLIQKKQTLGSCIAISICFAVLTGTSAFVAATFLLVACTVLITTKRSWKNFFLIIFSFGISLVFTLPLLAVLSSNQAGITFAPYLPILPHLSWLKSSLLFYAIETGAAIPILIFLTFQGTFKGPSFQGAYSNMIRFLFIATVGPLVLSRLITSQFMNDVGMRIPIIYTIFLPFLMVYLVDKAKLSGSGAVWIKRILTITIVAGASSGMLELFFQSKKIESYPESLSAIYRVTTRFTDPEDSILVNDAYVADRMPILSLRMTFKPEVPFSMDVYVPKRDKTNLPYTQTICPVYARFKKQLPNAPVVYAELGNVAPLTCSDVINQKSRALILFSSPAVTLYRL